MTLGLNDPEAPSCDRRWQTKPLTYNVQQSHTAPSVPFSFESYIHVLVERTGQTLAPSFLDASWRESEVSAVMMTHTYYQQSMHEERYTRIKSASHHTAIGQKHFPNSRDGTLYYHNTWDGSMLSSPASRTGNRREIFI